ncbi:MAG: Crp/Fnr family transcriptional regulator, partial [Chitinophagaceae bacterium]
LLMKQCEPALLQSVQSFKHQYFFKKGQTLFFQGDQVMGVQFVQSGLIKLELAGQKKRPFILRLCGLGQPMGHRSVSVNDIQPYKATAVEDSRVCFIEMDFFNGLLKKSESLRKALQKIYLKEIKDAENKLINIAHHSVREKVANVLLELSEVYDYKNHANGIRIQVDRQEMADLAGTTKEQVSKVLAQFTREKIIRFKTKHFKYLDIESLHKIAEGEEKEIAMSLAV